MPTIEQVREVLATINDPELHRSIVELGMVKGIDVAVPLVTVDLALTIPGCPLKSFFQEVLPAKIQASFPEITQVTVNLGAMTDEERKALVGGVKSESPSSFAGPQSRTTVLAIGSGKGGVGKSTLTANLAAALAKRGHSVGLLDADIWGFSSSRMLGTSAKPTVIDERLIVPVEAYGFKMISMGNLVEDDRPVVMRGPMLHKILQSFLSDVHWEEPDYLLIDMPPGTGDISLSLSQFVPGCSIILITTPQQAAEKVAERAGHMAGKVGMKVAGVIENMAYAICEHCGERTHPFGSGGGQELAETFGAPLLGQIPLDPPMGALADHGKPSVIVSPDSPSAVAFEQVTQALVSLIPPKPRSRPRRSLPIIMSPAAAPAPAG
ncbi:MAG TPA: Mrp/NBP35 family ATP-binding protein [Actinomycetota bacterium]|nr:Mrp/NBP35 family ATP-binding protein [Actinomycetota bacterium]